ncbi:MAG: flagellar biosynthetic protein FliP [Deltaproteobacteria bacterium RIFCSPLOWO2_02_FULL_53_8]|nr:MAG: flagellar biosynthetic protein FliP [Deltaproteobacteria bacterium RIFCSPLOWO2_02_FULL_53_8]
MLHLFGGYVMAAAPTAQTAQVGAQVSLSLGSGRQATASLVQLVLLVTVLTVTPAMLLLMTSFTRIVVVFSILRQALGIQDGPSNTIIAGFSFFLTLFIMSPLITRINDAAIQPYMSGAISADAAVNRGVGPLREFMLKNTKDKDLELFMRLSKPSEIVKRESAPTLTIIPAFITSELKAAFQIGFLIYIPFLIIDMVAASVLVSLGMVMLPPSVVSLPFKLLLFVLVDGWYLIVGSLVQSFNR